MATMDTRTLVYDNTHGAYALQAIRTAGFW